MNKRHNKKQEKKKIDLVKKHQEKMFDDCYNLDVSIAEFILPRLRYLKGYKFGYPSSYNSFDDWAVDLQKMIDFFKMVAEDRIILYSNDQENREGLELFCKHYFSLWI